MATTTFEKPMGSEVETLKSSISTLNSNITTLTKSIYNINQSASSDRGTIVGQILSDTKECTVNLTFTSSATATNSPGIIGLPGYKPKRACALSCIDITSGISSSITGQVPCGISSDSGTIFVKEITTGHIYAITGTYIRNN